jgi:hypothetical protein
VLGVALVGSGACKTVKYTAIAGVRANPDVPEPARSSATVVCCRFSCISALAISAHASKDPSTSYPLRVSLILSRDNYGCAKIWVCHCLILKDTLSIADLTSQSVAYPWQLPGWLGLAM